MDYQRKEKIMSFLRDLFDTVGYIAGETKDLFDGIAEDTKQLNDELLHFYDSSYVSPYEKKHQAAERIDNADRKMDKARSRYEKHVKRVEERLQTNLKRKQELLGKIENEKNSKKSSRYSSYDYTSIESVSFRNKSDFKAGEFLGIFGHDIMEQAANSYLEDAKDYEVEAKRVCAKIENYDAKLSRIEDQIDIEEKIIDTLESQIVSKNMSGKTQVAQAIRNLLNTTICDKNGNIQQKYVQELENLKKFC